MSEDKLYDIYCELADISATLAIMASKPDMVMCRECKYAEPHSPFYVNCRRGLHRDSNNEWPIMDVKKDGCAEGAKKEAD